MIGNTIKEGIDYFIGHYIVPFLAFLAVYFTPIEAEVLALTIVIMVQMITAKMASSKENHAHLYLGWKKYVQKAISYVLIIILFFLLGEVWDVWHKWNAASVVAGFLAMKETKICIDHTGVISGKNLLEELKKLLQLLK